MRTRKEPLSQSGKENLHLPTTEESLYVLSATILYYKASNMKRHHETRHSNFSNNYPLKSALRRSKLTEFKSLLNSEQTLIKTFNNEGDTTTEASFIISWNIARAKHSYSDGEFVKKNIAENIAVLDPTNRKSQRLASQPPVSRHTVRKEDLSDQC